MSTTELFRERRRGPESRDAETPARRVGTAAASVWGLVGVSVVVAAASLLFPSTPTYDPWAWIIWGREILALDLDTRLGPSWKPLPVVLTTAFAPLGDAAPALWLVVARAGALLALFLAARVASRLAGGGLPGIFAGAFAAAALVLSTGWVLNGLQGSSEGLLVALVLWGVDRHLDGAYRQALVLAFAAGLLRPEAWPFLGLYALWLAVRDRGARPLGAALLALTPVLWFLPEWWGSGDALRASTRARNPDLGTAAFAERPALEVTGNALGLVSVPVHVGFALALAAALVALARGRGGRVTLALAATAAAWVGIVAAMTEAGYAGNPRYLILAGGLACVLAGAGWAHAVRAAALVAARRGWSPRAAAGVSAAVAVALLALSVPFARPHVVHAGRGVAEARSQAELYHDLPDAVEAAGGAAALAACGRVATGKYRVPVVAWHLDLHLRQVGIYGRVPGSVLYAFRAPRITSSRFPYTGAAHVGDWHVFTNCSSR